MVDCARPHGPREARHAVRQRTVLLRERGHNRFSKHIRSCVIFSNLLATHLSFVQHAKRFPKREVRNYVGSHQGPPFQNISSAAIIAFSTDVLHSKLGFLQDGRFPAFPK